MGRKLFLFGVGALALAAPLGCTKQVVRDKTPPDPLLVSKKPVEGKQNVLPAEPRPRAEFPPPPPAPARVLGLQPVPGEGK
jgi:hypothetical protein